MSAPSAQQIWKTLARRSFAVLSHVTPAGEPRSSGVVYTVSGDRMFVVVAKDSWKARHIAAHQLVSVTVPVRRGGLLSLVAPIPPATVSFPAVALVHSGEILAELPRLAAVVPPERRASCTVLELRPTGHYVTYGIDVPLLRMRDPARARARVAVRDSVREG
ncbi:hypothetical protein BJY16_006329 [Actinoplanes octamycinicus]|uniref:Pyridoxamine 5'-phosphate oxidase n=1 Tax=Actinoplanes octamycinicus TaxID=135948 RepID=A0A7W7H2Q9_9ACTN|nr:pyridoxamine 5'-phosphate oxidase family protein [Actinoplanes octamycinicus]MBB4742870.1 hypothetical protein [Actinoplanes octamycinicus]GIE58277.1 hypothetical protein Aoc01nite_36790 [Actinoplanes octamycinicus]